MASRRRPDTGASTLVVYKQQVNAFVKWLPTATKTIRNVTTSMTEPYIRELERKMNVPAASKHVW